MKTIIFLIALLLIFSCEKERKDNFSKKEAVNRAIDSAAVHIDSSNTDTLKENEVEYEEPKDGFYSKNYVDGD